MEVTGLVLALFPIVVNGLSGLADAANTFETLRKSAREIARYARGLKRELAIYRDTITELLEGIADSDDDLQLMIQDPQDELWSSSVYEGRLQKRLDHSYDVFTDTIDEVHDEMQELVDKLKLRTDTSKNKTESFLTGELQRVRVAFNKSAYTELYARIQNLNNYLRDTTQQSIRLEPKRQKHSSAKHNEKLRLLRQHARRIHQTVTTDKCWNCTCRDKHTVALRMKPVSEEKDIFSQPWRLGVHLGLSGSTASSWHILELQPFNVLPDPGLSPAPSAQHSISQKGTKKSVSFNMTPVKPDEDIKPTKVHLHIPLDDSSVRINDLCSTLRIYQRPPANPKLGFLEADEGHWGCSVSYDKSLSEPPSSSLETLLHKNAERRSATHVIFSRRERLAAAATLAWSVLFLDGSWLQNHWTSSDVLLIKDAERFTDTYGTERTVDELAFTWTPCRSCPSMTTVVDDLAHQLKTQTLAVHRINGALFTLALLLIELSLGEPLKKLKTDEERHDDYVGGNKRVATRLLPLVESESGPEYHEVVRRCLDCPFDVRDRSLDNEKFLSLVFEGVVRPLIKDFERFRGF